MGRRRQYTPSRELVHCASLAHLFAYDRGSSVIRLSDLLAAIYVFSRESPRLETYWPKWQKFEHFIATQCNVEGSREDQLRRHKEQVLDGPKARHLFRNVFVYRPRKRSFVFRDFCNSREVDEVYSTACDLTISWDAVPAEGPPLLTPEHLLLAIAKHNEFEIVRELLESGLDVGKLEWAIRNGK